MELLAESAVPASAFRLVAAQSRGRRLAFAAGLLAVAAAGALVLAEDPREPLAWLFTLFFAAMFAFVAAPVVRTFRRSNWVLRAGRDGLYLKFRSHLNVDFPDSDPAVAFIPYAGVASVRRRFRRNRGMLESRLELVLDGGVPEALVEALHREADRMQDPKPGRSTFVHAPVLYDERNGSVHVLWRSVHDHVVPHLDIAIEALRGVVPIGRDRGRARRRGKVVGGLFVVLGLVNAGLAGASIVEGLLTWTWSRAQATVERSWLERVGTGGQAGGSGGSGVYRVAVVYHYEVAGTRYPGTVVRASDFGATRGQAERLARRFAPGARVPAWYDPGAPRRAVLVRGPGPLAVVAFVAGSIFVGAGWMLWRG